MTPEPPVTHCRDQLGPWHALSVLGAECSDDLRLAGEVIFLAKLMKPPFLSNKHVSDVMFSVLTFPCGCPDARVAEANLHFLLVRKDALGKAARCPARL